MTFPSFFFLEQKLHTCLLSEHHVCQGMLTWIFERLFWMLRLGESPDIVIRPVYRSSLHASPWEHCACPATVALVSLFATLLKQLSLSQASWDSKCVACNVEQSYVVCFCSVTFSYDHGQISQLLFLENKNGSLDKLSGYTFFTKVTKTSI